MLQKGANKEHRNISDYTPMIMAAACGHITIINLLLTYGADINSQNGSTLGLTPLMLSAKNGHRG